MITISNEDYGKVKRLLTNLTTCNPKDWRWREAKRLALLLLRKWKRAEKRPINASNFKDDKLYYQKEKGENRRV